MFDSLHCFHLLFRELSVAEFIDSKHLIFVLIRTGGQIIIQDKIF